MARDKKAKKNNGGNEIIKNKKALFDYEIIERYEAGIVLVGTEVKSLREKNVTIAESYGVFKGEELYLMNLNIAHYHFGNRNNHDPSRSRKLLLHKKELRKLFGKAKEQGFTIVPIRLYFARGKVKLELGLGKGKKNYDKRHVLKQKTIDREMERYIKK